MEGTSLRRISRGTSDNESMAVCGAKGKGKGKGKDKGKGKGKAGTVATVATVDQFIRHAESGFFGDDEEADCPFVWDGDC